MSDTANTFSALQWSRSWFAAGALAIGLIAVAVYYFWPQDYWPRAAVEDAPPQRAVDREPPRLSVRLAATAREPIQAWVFAEGTARSVQREYLTFEATGRVTFVGPKKVGTPVKAGEVLATLDKRTFAADVDAAVASIQEAQTQVEASAADADQADTSASLARRQFERVQTLYQQNAASQQELEESRASMENAQSAVAAAAARARAVNANIAVAEAKLKQAQVYLENAEIRSPIDGIVAYLNIEEGFYFTQNFVRTQNESEALQTIPIVVIDPSQYEVIVDVPSFESRRIEVGQKVLVLPGGSADAAVLDTLEGSVDGGTPARATADNNWSVAATVFSVNPAINPGGRSVQVRIRTTGEVGELRDGMFVTCWIATEENPTAIVAPIDAFLYEENDPYVFIYNPDEGIVERRKVTFGIRGLARREIASGVQAGDRLVTDGRYKLVDGAPVRPIE